MNIRLILPCAEYKEKIWNYKKAFELAGEEPHGTASLNSATDFETWLKNALCEMNEETVRPGLVPAWTFLAVNENDEEVGMINIRHRLSEYLFNFGGNIGYSVSPLHRRKGYGAEMLALGLQEFRKLGTDKCLITCNKNNIASAKTILHNGGVLENEVINNGETIQRYWITL